MLSLNTTPPMTFHNPKRRATVEKMRRVTIRAHELEKVRMK
jgi:hypothetical protein